MVHADTLEWPVACLPAPCRRCATRSSHRPLVTPQLVCSLCFTKGDLDYYDIDDDFIDDGEEEENMGCFEVFYEDFHAF